MENAKTFSVAVPEDMVADLRAAVDDGDYGSVGEVVHEALQDWRLRRRTNGRDKLRRLVQEGMDSGPGLDADEVFAKLRSKFGNSPNT